jgi:hypothetical protein
MGAGDAAARGEQMIDQRRHRRRVRRLRPVPASAEAALAADLAWELSLVAHLPTGRTELELGLRGQVEILLNALVDEPFQPHRGAEVGAYLVGIQATGSEALRRTLLLLADRLPRHLPSTEAARYRVTRLLVEVAAGWADAARERPPAGRQTAFRAAPAAGPRAARSAQPPNPWFD